ncbi:MAG: helicase HerA domain-containing protein [Halodesulfurarchaeum sp.]
MAGDTERIVVSRDGLSLPVIEVLTGRGAIFGKSGSGKSNTASVVVEELLEKGFPVLIVDVEGEYATLSDRYEVVHIGDGDHYDNGLFEVDPGQVVDFCLDQHRPVVIDVSEVLELERAERVITDVLQLLFSREKHENKPFLVIVEEVHEFLPQQGGLDDLGEMLIRIAKRGRKRGLGLLGMSQRPASVDKNFITQCDWLVFHRLTWENDTRVVKSILGSDYAEDVKDLATGSAYLLADWEETVREVRFREKRTADAGDTPSLSASERRDLTATRRDSPASETNSTASTPSKSTQETETESTTDDAATDSGGEREEGDSTQAAESETVEPLDPDPPTVLRDPEPEESTELAETDSTDDPEPAARKPADDAAIAEPAARPENHAEDPPSEPAAETLWELGQFVTYALVRAIGSVTYGLRVAYAKLMGHSKPADRLGPLSVEESSSRPAPSRFAIRILGILVGIILLLLVLAIAGV